VIPAYVLLFALAIFLKGRKTAEEAEVAGTDIVPPQSEEDQFDDDHPEFVWTLVYTIDDSYVWKYSVSTGLLYDDGTDTRGYEDYYVIGNADHTSFVRESQTATGHIQIDGSFAKVYADEAAAIAEADRMNEPDDGTGPSTGPVSEPDDDGETVDPTLPVKPGFGFGNYTPSFGVI
jgi:hypothetical protein